MSIDTQGLAAHRLGLARQLLIQATHTEAFHHLTGDLMPFGSIALARHWNLVYGLMYEGNAQLLASDVAWSAIWRELHIMPEHFATRVWDSPTSTDSFTGPQYRTQLEQRLQLSVLRPDGTYAWRRMYNAHIAARLPETTPQPDFTVEDHFRRVTMHDAMEWLGIAGARPSERTKTPADPLTFRDRSVEAIIGSAYAVNPSAYGGRPPYAFKVTSQPSPAIFASATGATTLTLPATDYSAGDTAVAEIEVTDAAGATATGTVTITAKAAAGEGEGA